MTGVSELLLYGGLAVFLIWAFIALIMRDG